MMDVLFVLGVIVAIFLVDRVGRIKLQIWGFIGCAVGLLLSGMSVHSDGTNTMWLLFLGFTLFYFMVNFGPNAMTYLLAGEVFPTEVRGKGAGFAASFAKIGAVLTAFLFPILLKTIGTTALLWGLVVCFLAGSRRDLLVPDRDRGREPRGRREGDGRLAVCGQSVFQVAEALLGAGENIAWEAAKLQHLA